MKDWRNSLGLLGVGPFYVIPCLLATLLGLRRYGRSPLSRRGGGLVLIPLGLVAILAGLALWLKTVIFQQVMVEIKADRLVTEGTYAYCRHPIYAAFLFLLTGLLVLAGNPILAPLPVFFWLYGTILLKYTEERWLADRYGPAYAAYCRAVNRFIPRPRQLFRGLTNK
ncbi:methyltransferase family protein [Peptococcus simiae]|uniref:methyltransferase family protein n=1 Tax=Peptococcus simiae TaxID=1643805 RepID=UPI00397EABA9